MNMFINILYTDRISKICFFMFINMNSDFDF